MCHVFLDMAPDDLIDQQVDPTADSIEPWLVSE